MTAVSKAIEELVEVASDRLSKLVASAIVALTEDGTPHDWEKLDQEQQLEEYDKLRNSPDAMFRYMDMKVKGFVQKLKENGLDDEAIAEIHPASIVVINTLNRLYELEQLARKREGNAVST